MIDFRRLFLSFTYAAEGIAYAFHKDQNLRIHVIVAFFVSIFGFWIGITKLEMWVIGIMALFVIVAEMLNTAIEQMVDLISLEHKKEAKIAKDVSAGMVFFTVFAAVVVGLFIFIPRIL